MANEGIQKILHDFPNNTLANITKRQLKLRDSGVSWNKNAKILFGQKFDNSGNSVIAKGDFLVAVLYHLDYWEAH